MSVSAQLRNEINNNLNEYSTSTTDACGCEFSEFITINNVSTGVAESVIVELCEDEMVFILGQAINFSDKYDEN